MTVATAAPTKGFVLVIDIIFCVDISAIPFYGVLNNNHHSTLSRIVAPSDEVTLAQPRLNRTLIVPPILLSS